MSTPPRHDGNWPDAETAALLGAAGRQPRFALAESGPDCERLRAHAFRVMVLRPLARLLRRSLRRLAEHAGVVPAYRIETARKACGAGE